MKVAAALHTWHPAACKQAFRSTLIPVSKSTPRRHVSCTASTCRPNFRRRVDRDSETRPREQRRYESVVRHAEPTIYALSTASGRAAIAIIRVSGPACLHIYRSLCPGKPEPKPRYATLRTLYEPDAAQGVKSTLDSNALVLYNPGPRTVTGEDILELHVHGGLAIVKAVLAAIPRCTATSHAIRYAEPGEFTRRAFMNNRLDLTQVEALGDVLSATTEQQRKLSVRGTTSTLAKTYERWRQQLLYARGELEALIDFSEDQHFDESPAELCASVSEQVRVLLHMVLAHSQNAMKGELLRHGISIALLGAPNVGKSSLLNQIVGREAAIVSHEAGTTRDVVEVGIDLGGYFCRLGDTAGLRRQISQDETLRTPESIGQIEKEGMRRSKERAAESDVVIAVLSFEKVDGMAQLQLDAEVISTATELIKTKDNVLVLINKTDLLTDPASLEDAMRTIVDALPGIAKDRIHCISCIKAERRIPDPPVENHQIDSSGIQPFLQSCINFFSLLTTALHPHAADTAEDSSVWQDSLGASERQRLLLLECADQLGAFLASVNPNDILKDRVDAAEPDIVVAAEHLRSAADCLARITGKGVAGDVEEVLGVVFEKFCVGK